MRTLVLAMVVAAQAQQPAARVEFEVVSIKPGDPNDPSSSGRGTANSMEMKNTTLATLVRSAYDLNEFQLTGGPKWKDTAKFDVVAKMPAGAPRDQMRQMMQTMLADRFQMVCHRETRTLSEYALVVSKDGAKLLPASEADKGHGSSSQGPRMIKGTAVEMASLARMLISVVGAPVIDRTGISGEYSINLRFAPLMGSADETLPDIFGAVQQLGLKLEPIKGPVEVLLIDRAEMPSEN